MLFTRTCSKLTKKVDIFYMRLVENYKVKKYLTSPYPYRMTIGGVRGGRPPHMLQRYMFLHPTLVLKPTDLNTV